MWAGLGVVAAWQLYAVRELLAAFALFLMVFGLIAGVIGCVYMLQKSWEAGVARLWASRSGWALALRRAVSAVEELSRRTIRRPASEV